MSVPCAHLRLLRRLVHHPCIQLAILHGSVWQRSRSCRLGRWQGSCKDQKHNVGLEQPICRSEGCLPAIIRVDEYVVITGPDVDLGEVLGIAEFCNEGGNQWQGVSVPDRPFIDIPIILTGSKVAPFLSNKKEPACLGRLQGTDEVFSDVVVKEGFYGFRFFW